MSTESIQFAMGIRRHRGLLQRTDGRSIALVGLSVVTQRHHPMGITAAAAVAIAMLLALTLTPALLGISGRHLLSTPPSNYYHVN